MRLRDFRLISLGLTAASLAVSTHAGAQACCAGSSAITPGRLGLHEDALVGLQLRGTSLMGSYDHRGRYRRSPPESSEVGLREDLVAGLRFLQHGQVAVLVPFVQTGRSVPGRSELGGGLGDVNLSLRYDLFEARRSAVFPGIAVLVGLTLPTGVPVESASNVLATDATGIGAVQTNGGVALEQIFGAWTVSTAALVGRRWPREVQDVNQALGAEWTFVAAGAYTFPSEVALAMAAAYVLEGEARIEGVEQRDTSRHLLTTTASAVVPLSDRVRLQGTTFVNPPFSTVGVNQTVLAGLSFMVIYAWL
jgi:hypothetical protein